MDAAYVSLALRTLSVAGTPIAPGLSDDEFARVEMTLSFQFPPDLRALLGTGLPISGRFPDWRNGSEEQLRWLLDGPVDGIAFDVDVNGYWRTEWGDRPADREKAIAMACGQLEKVPTLVPVFAHRFLSSEPAEEGNPVFSVSQTDVVVYGRDLADFLSVEFGVPRPSWSRSVAKPIRFWTEIADV